jgi:hypothetical protein
LRQADQHGTAWVRARLCAFIELEVSSGLLWGEKK